MTFKYNEDQLLAELRDYIASTYGQHYSAGNDSIQTLDLIEACGDAEFSVAATSSSMLLATTRKELHVGTLLRSCTTVSSFFTSLTKLTLPNLIINEHSQTS